ncbi:hypothetical protein BDW75DRAFT_240537 [Aspergillus navahoensis]
MKLLASLVSGVALSGIAAAIPQAQTSTSASTSTPMSATPTGSTPQVTVYDEQNYQGESLSFAPNVTCQTLLPRIESVRIPDDAGETIYCQLFDNAECAGEGGRVTISSLPALEENYPAIICGVLV